MAGPVYDSAWIILCPLWCLALGYLIAAIPGPDVIFLGQRVPWYVLLLRTFIHAHLFAVVFRSHGNAAIFRKHPVRFTWVPLLTFALMLSSPWLMAIAIVITTYWDIYHSSMQTFGFARLYDQRAGGDAQTGRTLDIWLNHALYVAPFLAGPTLFQTLQVFSNFDDLGWHGWKGLYAFFQTNRSSIRVSMGVLSTAYIVFYSFSFFRLYRQGYPFSPQKVALHISTGISSVAAQGFGVFGQALFIINMFHAVQYLAMVWWAEKRNMMWRFSVENVRGGTALALATFLVLVLGYGFWFGAVGNYWSRNPWLHTALLAITNLVALMHFWYDGFIWSVRRKEVL